MSDEQTTHRTDAYRYFILGGRRSGRTWVQDEFLKERNSPIRRVTEWEPTLWARTRRVAAAIAWYVFDRILIPFLTYTAAMVSAVAVLIGMKM